MFRDELFGLLGSCETIPRWLEQRVEISKNKKTWDDYSFEERTCKGWLIPYLIEIDARLSTRWAYWLDTLDAGKMLDRPIPQIDFLTFGASDAMKNLQTCLSRFMHLDVRLSNFLDWLLWGFNIGEERPRIDPQVNEFWYRNFNLGFMLRDPFDYFGEILCDAKSGYWNNPNAFYPTPHTVCQAMASMQFSGEMDYRDKTVLDPCVGTGRMLMFASNYSLRLFGQDIDRICVQACQINGFLYMPWLVAPGKIFPAPGTGLTREDSLTAGLEADPLPLPLFPPGPQPEIIPSVGNLAVTPEATRRIDKKTKPQQLLLFD